MRKWLSKFTGLNNRVADTRVNYDEKTGVSELSVAVNVDIDESGRISRRRGFTSTLITSASHSLHCANNEAFVVIGDSLYQIFPDYTTKLLRSGLTINAPMYYCTVNGQMYYSNNFQNGFIEHGDNHNWTANAYVGHVTHRTFNSPPLCTIIEHHSGRLFIVVLGEYLYYSELYAFAWFDLANNYLQYSSEITMVKSVTAGLYVSDSNNVHFLMGRNPKEFETKIVSTTPAISGTAVKTQGKFINQGLNGEVVLWTSSDGIWCGDESGNVQNLTKDSLLIPSGASNIGAAVVDETKKKYITIINS